MKEREDIIRNKGSSHEIRENCLRVTSFRDTVFPSIHVSLSLSLILYIYTRFPLRTCRVKIIWCITILIKLYIFFLPEEGGRGRLMKLRNFDAPLLNLFYLFRDDTSFPLPFFLFFFFLIKVVMNRIREEGCINYIDKTWWKIDFVRNIIFVPWLALKVIYIYIYTPSWH